MRFALGFVLAAVTLSGCLSLDEMHCMVAGVEESCGEELQTRQFGNLTEGTADGILDTDNDTVPDDVDVFPNDATEYADQDGDGVGDAADDDDDDDGTPDGWDKHPWGDARAEVSLRRLKALDACDPDDATCEFVLLFSNGAGGSWARWPTSGYLSLETSEEKEISETIAIDVPEDVAEFVLVIELIDDDGDDGASSVDISPDSTRRLVWRYRLAEPPGDDDGTAAGVWDGRDDGLSETDAVAHFVVVFR